ncbi:hypothetical protein Taro_049478 [Colocasia esculenta]|uniref:Uncharacterized protein n=1 Tax=Colocasia esculenta TaxID=4460 RepID=A0A843XAX9_COLES|nr:hypothetical protein [Colocasia esculenta]
MPHSGHVDWLATPATNPNKPHRATSQSRSHGPGRTTPHKSEGVQEDDKTSSVPSTGTSPEHTHVPGSHKTWGSQLKRYPW